MLEENVYVLYGNKEALALYEDSLEKLLYSDSMDFMVHQYSGKEDTVSLLKDLSEWEGYVFIDGATHEKLYHNLCVKARKFIVAPMHLEYLNGLKKSTA